MLQGIFRITKSDCLSSRRSGFTLIELSIVVVVIALIAGGVLLARELVHAATLRRFISQVEQLNTAVNAFRSKYNCLPGDCMNATGFFGTTDANGYTVTNGNGDGQINERWGNNGATEGIRNSNYETQPAFQMLSLAGLIEGAYNPTSTYPDVGYPALPFNGRRTGIIVVNYRGKNYWRTGMGYNATTNWYTTANDLAASDGYTISSKIADGSPRNGTLMAVGGPGHDYWLFLYANNWTCVNPTTNQWSINPSLYWFDTTLKYCNLLISAAF